MFLLDDVFTLLVFTLRCFISSFLKKIESYYSLRNAETSGEITTINAQKQRSCMTFKNPTHIFYYCYVNIQYLPKLLLPRFVILI